MTCIITPDTYNLLQTGALEVLVTEKDTMIYGHVQTESVKDTIIT